MIPLDDRRWAELSHAYGSATDIPQLLSALSEFPSDLSTDAEPWHSLWSALCHQGDVYSASFAAVPHIVEMASRDPARACASYFHLPASIELARIAHQFDVPDHLLRPYSAALMRFPEIGARAATRDWASCRGRPAEPGRCDTEMHIDHGGRRLRPRADGTNDVADSRDAMTFKELVAWAWQETPPVHENRTNLLIHLVAVPAFAIGHFTVVIGILGLAAWVVMLGVTLVLISLVLQKRGHALERQRVHAFASAKDFIRRLYAEQFYNFWRFLFSGRWYASFKRARPNS